MECPHCHSELLRRNRANNTCGVCKRQFALEPFETTPRSHDLRLVKAATALMGENRQYRYTEAQLHWRLLRNRLEKPFGRSIRKMFGSPQPHLRVPPAATPQNFRVQFVERWRRVYGTPPDGIVLAEDAWQMVLAAQLDGKPEALVLAADADPLGCLAANDVPRRLGVALAGAGPDGRPVTGSPGFEAAVADPEIPVLLLHDASISGVGFANAARAMFGARVKDLGLTPAQARRTTLPRTQGLETELPPGLVSDPEDAAWLAAGYAIALGTLPPARLIHAVEKALGHSPLAGVDPQERTTARMVGFV